MKRLSGKHLSHLSALVALALLTGCNSAPKEAVIPSTAPPTVSTLDLNSPAVQNNPKIPAFIKNGGLDRLHQEALDHARSLQAMQKKQ